MVVIKELDCDRRLQWEIVERMRVETEDYE